MRKPRKLKPNAKYHVTARANRGEMILHSSAVKELFLSVLHRARKKYRFVLFNFCIMSNHIHLMIQPLLQRTKTVSSCEQKMANHGSKESEEENLSRIMQWIFSVFAKQYNKLTGLTGHVWYDRFHSTILENYFDYLNTYIYIMWNPVRAKIVRKPTDYAYNGITFMLKGMVDLFMPS